MSANETAVFSLAAQVYALDKTQKWTPLTQDVIQVVFLFNESTGVTRIHAVDKGVAVINSTILPNMQYRRPSETFVQWFDSQHILYGLNLTSVADADNFEKEFDNATKSTRKPVAQATSPAQSAISGPATPTAPSRFKLGGSDSNLAATAHANNSSNNNNNSSSNNAAAQAPTANMATSNGAAGTREPSAGGPAQTAASSSVARPQSANQQQHSQSTADTPMKDSVMAEPTLSTDRLVTSFGKPPVTDSKSVEAKTVATLRARVKELEMQCVTMQADKSQLHETIASQTKNISALQKHITQLEADIDKLKAAFQQNSGNVNIWKQQLQTYQDVNDQLTTKMNELTEVYEKFGDILRRE